MGRDRRAATFAWLRQRARRNAELFDGYRVDHLVGFYRTYVRPLGTAARPAVHARRRAAQTALGERVLSVFREAGAEIIAEDLGVVPDFVRASLARLGVPGCKVFRWERHWHKEGRPFRDPLDYPPVSVATSGTHDTEPMAIWWEPRPIDERDAVLAIPSFASACPTDDRAAAVSAPQLPSAVRDALLEALLASGSDLLICRSRTSSAGATASTAGDGQRSELDLAAAVAERAAGDRARGHAVAAQLRAWAVRHRR